jgi:hypothetical protein
MKCRMREMLFMKSEKMRIGKQAFILLCVPLIILKNLTGNLNKSCLKFDPELIRLPPEEASKTLLTPSTVIRLKIILKFKFGFLLFFLSMNLNSQDEQSYVSSVQYFI